MTKILIFDLKKLLFKKICFEIIFSIMASSVPSESLFSEAGDQVTDKRNRLDPDKVNKMMVVEDFFKFGKKINQIIKSFYRIFFI